MANDKFRYKKVPNLQIGDLYLTELFSKVLVARTEPDNLGVLSLISAKYPTRRKNLATKGYVDASIAGILVNYVVDHAYEGNVNIQTDLEAGDPIDSNLILHVGEFILLKDQTDQRENGVYTVNSEGPPSRVAAPIVANGQIIYVQEGSVNEGRVFVSDGTYATPNYGVDNIIFGTVQIWPQAPFGGTGGTGGSNLILGPGKLAGNPTNVTGTATSITIVPDFVLSPSGTLSLGTSGVTPGTYNLVTVNSKGLVTFGTNTSAGTGTVTSVAVAGSNGIGVAGSPITTAGTISLTLGNITPTSVSATGTVSGSNLSGTNTGDQTIAISGDASGTGTGAITLTIGSNAVTYSKIQQVSPNVLLGNAGTTAGDVQEIGIGNGLVLFSGLLDVQTESSQIIIGTDNALALADTGVTPGTGYNTFTVDSKGRITAASTVTSGTGTVTNIATGTGLVGGPITNTGTIAMDVSGVTAGTYGNGSNTVQISVDALGRILTATNVPITGGTGFDWVVVPGTTQNMTSGTGYITSNPALTTLALPITAQPGDIIAIAGANDGGWQITQAAGQTIHFGRIDSTTGTGGFLASTYKYDYVELLCIVANTDFMVKASIGNISIN